MDTITKGPIWLFDIPEPKALLIVAHADDETIFAGGLILSSCKTTWTIICCKPETSKRKNEFLSACRFLSKKSGNHIDSILLTPILNSKGGLEKLEKKDLEPYRTGYDIIFMHNNMGEYGNEDHKLVHRYVIDLIANSNTWVFISPGSTNVGQEELKSEKPGGNYILNLSPKIQTLKKRTFQEYHISQAECYGYDETGKLKESQLLETLQWEFESGKEKYTFYK